MTPNELPQVVATNHEEALQLANLKREESNLARCYIELHDRLSTLTAQGGDAVAWMVTVPASRRGAREPEVFLYYKDQWPKAHAAHGDKVQPLYTTPPAPSSSAVEGIIRDALDTMRDASAQADSTHGSPKQAREQWKRYDDAEQTILAQVKSLASTAASGGGYTESDLAAEYTRGRCDGFDAAKSTAAPAIPDGSSERMRLLRKFMAAGDLTSEEQREFHAMLAASAQGDGDG